MNCGMPRPSIIPGDEPKKIFYNKISVNLIIMLIMLTKMPKVVHTFGILCYNQLKNSGEKVILP